MKQSKHDLVRPELPEPVSLTPDQLEQVAAGIAASTGGTGGTTTIGAKPVIRIGIIIRPPVEL